MAETVYNGQIKLVQGKLQVTETYSSSDLKQVVRQEALEEVKTNLNTLSNETVHKYKDEEGNVTEDVEIKGNLKVTDGLTTNKITTTTNGIQINGELTTESALIANSAEIGDSLSVKGTFTVDGQQITRNSDPVVVVQNVKKAEINAPEIKLIADDSIVIKATNLNETKKAEIKAPEIEIDASNNLTLNSTTISLNGTANTTTASALADGSELFNSMLEVTGEKVNIQESDKVKVVNINTLADYDVAVDTKIISVVGEKNSEETQATVWGAIQDIRDNISNGLHFIVALDGEEGPDKRYGEELIDQWCAENSYEPIPGDLFLVDTREYVYSPKNSGGNIRDNLKQLGEEDAHATYAYVDKTFTTKPTFDVLNESVNRMKEGLNLESNQPIPTLINTYGLYSEKKNDIFYNTLSAGNTGVTEIIAQTINLNSSYDINIKAPNSLSISTSDIQLTIDETSEAPAEFVISKTDDGELKLAGPSPILVENKITFDDTVTVTPVSLDLDTLKTLTDVACADKDTLKNSPINKADLYNYNTAVNYKIKTINTDLTTDINELGSKLTTTSSDLTLTKTRVEILENKLPNQGKIDTGLFGELETDPDSNLTGALIIRTFQKPATVVNGINNNEIY